MKRKLTFAIFLALNTAAFAQPVIEAAHFPAASHSESFDVEDPNSLTPGGSGANQIWDFSEAVPTVFMWSNISLDIIPVESAPLASTFPSANYCVKRTNVEGNLFYAFYNISATAMELVGTIYVNGFPYSVYPQYLSDTEIQFQFPYSYNTSIADTAQSPESTAAAQINSVYDAYGTLITPFGTYNDVIRYKHTSIQPNGSTQTFYYWYNSNPFYEIMRGDFGGVANGENNYIQIHKNTTFLGVVQQEQAQFSVYPNPTTGDFTIGNTRGLRGTATVYDMLGKVVMAEADLDSSNTISLKNCSAGVYFVQVTDQNKRVLQTRKIIKE